MARNSRTSPRRGDALSRDRIIDAAIELLDRDGEAGLTFRTLSEHLATGPGAIYGHIANKSDLMVAACDTLVARTLAACTACETPAATLRGLALGMFDTIDAHPWVGAVLTRAPGHLPIVRIVEGIGQQVDALGASDAARWSTVSAFLNYILGVAGQNAANTHAAQARGTDRRDLLGQVAVAWAGLDPVAFPFASSVAAQMQAHDDREDFLAGVELLLKGMGVRR